MGNTVFVLSGYLVLMGSPDGKRPRGISRSGIEDNSKFDIKETEWGRA